MEMVKRSLITEKWNSVGNIVCRATKYESEEKIRKEKRREKKRRERNKVVS